MKAIICDLDGTLCESRKSIKKDSGKLITELSNKYHFIIITGGSWHRFPEQVFGKVGDCTLHCFSSMGTEYRVFKKIKGKMYVKEVYKHHLSDVQKFGIRYAVNCLADNVSKLSAEAWKFEDKGGTVTFSATGKDAPLFLKKDFDPTGEKRRSWIKIMKEERMLPFDVKVQVGGNTSLDFMLKGGGKKHALSYFMEKNKLKEKDVIYFGDSIFENGNDEEVMGFIPYKQVNNPQETYELLRQIK